MDFEELEPWQTEPWRPAEQPSPVDTDGAGWPASRAGPMYWMYKDLADDIEELLRFRL
jgi:hypothetical protein